MYRFTITLSDVDRGVYETLDLRVARHPSESLRYLLTRVLAYCLCYEEGIAFSKGGLSLAEQPPLAVRDATGLLRVWIDVGTPSADRLHKASKAADRVVLFTHSDLIPLRREVAAKPIHRVEDIEVWQVELTLLDALETRLERTTTLEVVHSDGDLYVTAGAVSMQGALVRGSLC